MCNEITIRVHTSPGNEVICQWSSHLIGFEGGGPATSSGVTIHTIDGHRGTITTEQIAAAVSASSRCMPRSMLVSIEQPAHVSC